MCIRDRIADGRRWLADFVDEPDRWAMTVGLIAKAPQDVCTVDVTPRRRQHFQTKPGDKVTWTSTPLAGGHKPQAGEATADRWGIVTLGKVVVGKGKTRLTLSR